MNHAVGIKNKEAPHPMKTVQTQLKKAEHSKSAPKGHMKLTHLSLKQPKQLLQSKVQIVEENSQLAKVVQATLAKLKKQKHYSIEEDNGESDKKKDQDPEPATVIEEAAPIEY